MAKIFVASHFKSILELIEATLSGAHYGVIAVSSLENALAKIGEAQQGGVTVALLDGNLGTSDHDGLEVAMALRAAIPGIKIIFIGGLDREELKLAAAGDGTWQLLRKNTKNQICSRRAKPLSYCTPTPTR